MAKELMAGNEAAAEAAIRAGCRYYFGYPITPQNELTAYMARRLPKVGGVFLQAESEIAAISMVHGAAVTGARAMTSSSSPGISLKQEGISYLAGNQLPAVVVNVMRGGPGLGNIAPSQGDYFQATKGGGHGDYRVIVLAPHTVQEATELMGDAFDLADTYRNPALILMDGWLGQMMEPVEFKERPKRNLPSKNWALTGAKGREPFIIRSLFLVEGVLEKWNEEIQRKYREIEAKEVRFEALNTEDADIVLAAFGTCARICKETMGRVRKAGVKVGVFRPVTLWPYPYAELRQHVSKARAVLVVEMNAGQMVEDVRLACEGRLPVHFHGRMGGGVPTTKEVEEKVTGILSASICLPSASMPQSHGDTEHE